VSLTIQAAIDRIIAAVPGAPFEQTVDVVKAGDPSQPLSAVAVTFLASADAIAQAAHLGANLLISHEPVFYSHLDQVDWLQDHPLYQAKRALIEQNRIVVWRFHDYLHSIPPDATVMGLIEALGWNAGEAAEYGAPCQIPEMSLGELAEYVKTRLGLPLVRVAGDPALRCARAAILPGAPGGRYQIPALASENVDVVITGEIDEWEIPEYARDAARLGFAKGLIVTGHAASEEPGMRWILPWLQKQLPEAQIHFIPTPSPFQVI